MVGLFGFVGPAAAQVAPLYALTDLTPATGTESAAFGVNAAGLAVGYSGAPNGIHQATRWTAGVGTLLSNLAGDTFSEARGINAAGTVAGFSSTGINGSGQSTGDKAVTWIGTVPTNLAVTTAPSIAGVTGPALTGSRAEAISTTGEIVGHAYSGTFLALGTADGVRGFYRSATGVVTRLDPSTTLANYPNDAALSYGINSSSQVFGQSDPGGPTSTGYRASRWNGATATGTNLTPFTYPTSPANPTLTDYLGFKGNDANRIVGIAEAFDGTGNLTQASPFAADTTNGTNLLSNLGAGTFGIANAISNAAINIIVGGSGSGFGAGVERAVAWSWNSASPTPTLTPIDLNTRLWPTRPA